MSKQITKSQAAKAVMLRGELTKVRCWLTGYNDGRAKPGMIHPSVPGEDSLRQTIMFLDELVGGEP